MSAKAISEFDAKRLVAEHIKFDQLANKFKAVSIRHTLLNFSFQK